MSKKRYYWLDLVKILACFFVVINHTGGYLLEFTNNANYSVVYYSLNFALCKVGVPLFIMVTGYLLLSKKEITYQEVLKRIFRIFVPLFLITLLLYVKDTGIKNFNFLKFILCFIEKPYFSSFWYLYMFIGLYSVSPFIKKMISNFTNKDYQIFLSVFLLLPSLLTIIISFLNINISSNFTQSFFPLFIGLLVAGVYFSKIKLNKRNFYISLIVFICSWALGFASLYIPYLKSGVISYKFDSYNLILILESVSFFYIFRYLFENKKFSELSCKIIKEISLATFGIYLTHYLIAYRLYHFSLIQNVFTFNPIVGIIVLEIGLFLVCGLLTSILRRIPIIKNFC